MPAVAWETAHGPTDNTGFVDVVTAPAQYGARTIDDIGTIAAGAGPVVAADGVVYLVNNEGKLMSFKPDGTPGWSRTIAADQGVFASPAIGSDGTIYVVGLRAAVDHRVDPPVTRVDASLHRFSAGGAYLGPTPFPEHNGAGGTTAFPNLWRFNGVELVVLPAVYRRDTPGGGFDVRLLAFSNRGALVIDQHASTIVPEIGGGGSAFDFGGPADENLPRPPYFPGVGIFSNPKGGTPFILLSDTFRDLVGFTLSNGAFIESFRVHDTDRFMQSAPAILPDRHSVVGTADARSDLYSVPIPDLSGGAVFSGPNLTPQSPVRDLQAILSTPTRLADGRTVLIGSGGEMSVLSGRNVDQKLPLASQSNAYAAASRTHLFVSTRSALQTFDAGTLAEVGRVGWTGGGNSPPAIGPSGYVYAVAGNKLYVFPPPGGRSAADVFTNPQKGGVLVVDSDPAANPDSKSYQPPMTTDGNRLFACEKLDGDDCGKGDYQTIATAFCKKEGFIGAGHIEVDSKKIKAETLDGRYCSKKKCKVFDQIICANN